MLKSDGLFIPSPGDVFDLWGLTDCYEANFAGTVSFARFADFHIVHMFEQYDLHRYLESVTFIAFLVHRPGERKEFDRKLIWAYAKDFQLTAIYRVSYAEPGEEWRFNVSILADRLHLQAGNTIEVSTNITRYEGG